MNHRPIVELYWNRKMPSFLLLKFGRDPQTGFTVGYGPLVRISPAEMEDHGLDIILRCLDESKSDCTAERCELDNLDAAGLRRFRREHKLVHVTRVNESTIAWDPMKPERGGWISVNEEPIITTLPLSKEGFFSVIKRVFQEAE